MNLAMRMKVTGINQLWVADITYIRLGGEFVYLAVVLDKLLAQGGGLGAGADPGGAIWRWPRWSRPSSNGSRRRAWCTTPTAACNTSPKSMSRVLAPAPDHAQHEPARPTPTTTPSARASCAPSSGRKSMPAPIAIWTICARMSQEFIEQYYNRCRLHSALGYRPPEEFEQAAAAHQTRPAVAARPA